MPNGVPMSWFASSYAHAPLFVARGEGARFTDVDGNEYSDFNIADMSMFCGYAPEPVVRAVAADKGATAAPSQPAANDPKQLTPPITAASTGS